MTAVRIFAIAGTTDPAEDYRLIDSGLLVPVSALNARSGVTTTPTLTGTGSLTCNVSAFTCAIDGTSNSMQGVYRMAVDGATGITVTAGAAQTRIDLIYAQILDNAYDGSGQTKGQVMYLAGTAGSGVPPATPANSIALFTITVPASASSINFATATTSVFPYTVAVGGIVPVRNAADLPAAASGVQYRHRLDVTAAAGAVSPLESSVDGVTYTPVFDPSGFQWQTFATVWTGSVTNPSLGNGTLSMKYMKIGKGLFVRIHLFTGSTTTYGSGYWNFSMPYSTAVNNVPLGSAVADIGGTYSYGTSFVVGSLANAIFGSAGNLAGATSPGTWVANSVLDMSFFFETT